MAVTLNKVTHFEIADDEFDEVFRVIESTEFEGLINLEYDSKSDKKYVSMTSDQARKTGEALIAFAEEIDQKYA